MSDQAGVLQGTLDLILPTIGLEPRHGWAIAGRINRRARFYSLTRAGRRQRETEAAKWERLAAGVNLVSERT
jgi:PadR family transcriptional regulator, regulatory protein PadR